MATEFNVTTQYIDSEGNRRHVGFEQEVDAIRVAVNLPDTGVSGGTCCRASDNLPAWRNAYFRDLVMEDPELSTVSQLVSERQVASSRCCWLLTRAAITRGGRHLNGFGRSWRVRSIRRDAL